MATEASPPVDFYAAATSAVAVVLFAKFVTHRDHAPKDTRVWKFKWKWLHWACVVAAWSGFVVSLVVLGGLTLGKYEIVLRGAVGVLVVIAATILAIDVGRLERS